MHTNAVHHDSVVEKPTPHVGVLQTRKKSTTVWSILSPINFWRLQVKFWTELLPQTWEGLSFDQKLAWIVFGSYTFTLLTLIEMFAVKK